MANIKIPELRPTGTELFQDSESFLNELSHKHEMEHVVGGRKQLVVGLSISVQSINGNSVNANTAFNANTAVIVLGGGMPE